MVNHRTKLSAFVTATLTTCALLSAAMSTAHERDSGRKRQIKHVVIIFQENASFDHYFATYPDAKNTDGDRKSVV